jgi:hypothetical protein
MRIAVCDYCGHPFQVQLSRQLARRGHDVLHLHSADFVTPKGAVEHLPATTASSRWRAWEQESRSAG